MQLFVIVDSQPITLNGLILVLRNQYPETSLMPLSDTAAFLNTSFSQTPTLILLCNNAQNVVDFEFILKVKEEYPKAFLIIYDQQPPGKLSLEYLRRGVNGYLSQVSDLPDLFNCIETVLKGKIYLSQDVFGILFEFLVKGSGK